MSSPGRAARSRQKCVLARSAIPVVTSMVTLPRRAGPPSTSSKRPSSPALERPIAGIFFSATSGATAS
eukprot:9496619-Pyramimonas_sp.AAC.1